MTRKDFNLIAAALNESRTIVWDKAAEQAVADQFAVTVAFVARALATTNPNFDVARFVAACNA